MRLLVVLLAAFCLSATAQENEQTQVSDSIPQEYRKQSFIYNVASKFNDPLVARVALYNLLAEDPGNSVVYDSLAYSYFSYGQFASAALVSQQALAFAPEDGFALDIAANSFDRLGVKDKALTFYEKIYLKDNDLNILYKIAFVQLELERYAEAEQSVNQIIDNTESKDLMINFPKLDDNTQTQSVPLTVAAYRIKAMIEESKGNIEGAKAQYVEVLNMYPGFQVVQQQIRDLGKQE